MSIKIADTLYESTRAAIADACHTWLYANGLNSDDYVLATLRIVPREDIADEIEEWLDSAPFTPARDEILAELDALHAALTERLG